MAALGVALAAVAGCSSVNTSDILPDKKVEYKRSKQAGTNLEIPPDLSRDTIADGGVAFAGASSAVTTYSEYKAAQQGASSSAARGVLPDVPDIELKKDGDKRWLVVTGPADAVWDKTLDFWNDAGILLVEQDPIGGSMTTDWIENRANIKQDFVTNFLRSALDSIYSSGTRDQFRVRLERNVDPAKTEVYLTHKAMVEKLQGGLSGAATDADRTIWVHAPSDHELEAIMLQRLMVYMGVSEQQARQAGKRSSAAAGASISKLTTGSSPHLDLMTDFDRSWRLVGISLNRVGFTVEDRNRSEGAYYVRYNDPANNKEEGWLSKMAFWSSKDAKQPDGYIISVKQAAEELTNVTVLNENGTPAPSETASRILSLIHSQLR